MKRRPTESEYAPGYADYIAKAIDSDDIVATLEQQRAKLAELGTSIDAATELHRYADGKWSVREVFGHLGDGERVFGYRLFCISRGDQQPLPSFDENSYAANSGAHQRTLADLAGELLLLRDANLTVMRNLGDEAWGRQGVANNVPITVRALAYVMAGHTRHHLAILRDRYGVASA